MDKSGLYRWYNDYRLPEYVGEGQVTVRLHQSQEDRDRKFNALTLARHRAGGSMPAAA